MKGVELALRFSYITNHLRFCGPKEAEKEFLEYLEKRDNLESVRGCLERFEGLTPYLSAIGLKAGKDRYDYSVVEAYWIGNGLLEGFDDDSLKDIILGLMKRGLPGSVGKRLIEGMPSGLVPHHCFNVFYVGVGQVTGSVETTLTNMENCRVSWGKVVEVLEGSLIVQARVLKRGEKGYFLGEEEVKTVVYLPVMLSGVEKGDWVGIHWGFAASVLTEDQVLNLEKYTLLVLDVVNGKR
tara:strand:- start:425 stop:1141 length:717 start_codon:yes stop_codon:yes gene_type:complete